MPTVTCTLTFPDGKTLTGSIQSRFPTGSAPVKWSGEIERLPKGALFPVKTWWPSSLAALFQDIQRETGGEIEVRQDRFWPDENDLVGMERLPESEILAQNEMERKTVPIWQRWKKGEITDQEAVRLFVAAGVPESQATEAIFIVKGGSDIVGERFTE